jgi:hypothetical protein
MCNCLPACRFAVSRKQSINFRKLYCFIPCVRKNNRLRRAGRVARMGKRRGAYRALVGKPEGGRPLGRPRRRWEDNIKLDLRGVGWGGGMDWITVAQDRDRWGAVVNAVINLRVP